MDWETALKLMYDGLQALLLLALPIVVVAALNWLKQEWKRAHLPDWVKTYAALAVKAANQYLESNPDKKAYAVAALQAFLNAHGIKLDAAALDAAIEDAVAEAKIWEDDATSD